MSDQAEYMTAKEAAAFLIGKTIDDLVTDTYIFALCIEKIEFTDGTIAHLGGNADWAYISHIETPDRWIEVVNDDHQQ